MRRILLFFISAIFGLAGCGSTDGEMSANPSSENSADGSSAPASTGYVVEDKPLNDYQAELISLAFEAASQIPEYPHIKDREKKREHVAMACLMLDQPRRAQEYIKKIENHRRGYGYASLAYYCAYEGYEKEAKKSIEAAEEIADALVRDQELEHRVARIRAKIAQAHALLGQDEKAEEIGESIQSESETGKVEQVHAMLSDKDDFEEQIQILKEHMSKGSYDIGSNALNAYVALYDAHFDDEERRALVEKDIQEGFTTGKIPGFRRFEVLLQLAEIALKHEDRDKAIELLNQAKDMVDGFSWSLEEGLPREARLAELIYRAGQTEKAHAQADELWESYQESGESIVDVFRADALRPLAEAYHAMGRSDAAMKVYKRVMEDSVVNPNSRPRAEALVDTLLSLAVKELEPDEELWSMLRNTRQGLSNPW